MFHDMKWTGPPATFSCCCLRAHGSVEQISAAPGLYWLEVVVERTAADCERQVRLPSKCLKASSRSEPIIGRSAVQSTENESVQKREGTAQM